MSHGSWFSILRYNKKNANDLTLQKFLKTHKYILTDQFSNKTKTLNDIADYFAFKLNQHQYINVKNKKLYTQLMNVHFNSEFDCLTQFYNMNAYTKNCQITITYNQAKKIVQAINYITSQHYDKEFESILDNQYLKAFEYIYPVFDYRFRKIDKEYYNSAQYKYYCELSLSVFYRLKNILNAYITMVEQDDLNKEEYILNYNCY